MAFKYTCILLLVSLAFLLAQAKHVKKDKKGNTKQKGKYGISTLKTFILSRVCNWGLLLFEALTRFDFQGDSDSHENYNIANKAFSKRKIPTAEIL